MSNSKKRIANAAMPSRYATQCTATREDPLLDSNVSGVAAAGSLTQHATCGMQFAGANQDWTFGRMRVWPESRRPTRDAGGTWATLDLETAGNWGEMP